MKNKKIWTGLLSCLTALAMSMPVHAETFYGDDSWSVVFNAEKQMVSSFSTADINDVVGGMQPGDNVIVTLRLKNENPTATDWYMQNEVLYSLEDRSANSQTGGGAYTYRLTYTDHTGAVQTLFDSDTVGGENGTTVEETLEGLHGATSALKDFFYLDTVNNGEGGIITLEVALDGETQGNSYQDTLADLQMNFAVELRDDLPTQPTPNQPGTPPTPVDDTQPTPEPGRRTDVVRTSDESQLPLLAAISGVTGLMLLGYCIYCFREHKKKKGE
ncbi:hypothetical protein [uncultured Acetatifactor sp.]|uniref:hypothetical protein n=1 Tax=uncultured Acetatifactor sp. TaxID=1671927 RepID=UPI00260F17F0|nr:hypothetical protein [uncultured Acetatifactor sp.]